MCSSPRVILQAGSNLLKRQKMWLDPPVILPLPPHARISLRNKIRLARNVEQRFAIAGADEFAFQPGKRQHCLGGEADDFAIWRLGKLDERLQPSSVHDLDCRLRHRMALDSWSNPLILNRVDETLHPVGDDECIRFNMGDLLQAVAFGESRGQAKRAEPSR